MKEDEKREDLTLLPDESKVLPEKNLLTLSEKD